MAKQVGIRRRTWGAVAPVALLALAVTAGCAAQSEMTNLWKDPSFTSGPMRNVLVVALRKDPVRRRMWEDAFVDELGARGLSATPSYQLFPEAPPDTLEMIEALRKSDYDAVLVSTRLPNQTESTYVPGTVRRQTVTERDYYGVIRAYSRDVQSPGYTETDEIRRFQTDVWTTGDRGHLIWSGTLRTLESLSNRTIAAAVSRHIAPVLEKQGLVPAKR
jgi:hypothetical protein